MEDPAVTRFRQYLRIKSVHPNPDYGWYKASQVCLKNLFYDNAIEFIKTQGEEIGLEFTLVRFPAPAEFAVFLTWKGSDPSLQSVLLNSHIDVVPVDHEKWTYDPFEAVKATNGNIYARGTQDMKCVGMQYLEAIRVLKQKNFVPLRTIHVSFVPDEELGGKKGMAYFVQTPEFKTLNIGFGLDEGMASADEGFIMFNAERALWQIEITARGNAGHGSSFMKNTAAEKTQKIINAFLGLRDSQEKLLGDGGLKNLGNVTTVNLTMINGGLQANVIPSEIKITFDLRITPTWTEEQTDGFISQTCEEAGPDITYEYINKGTVIPETPITPDNIWWTSFKAACDEMDLKVTPIICPGATDAKYLRNVGIPAFGFSPMNNTPMLLHDHDEYLNENIYLKGIKIYEKLIQSIVFTKDK